MRKKLVHFLICLASIWWSLIPLASADQEPQKEEVDIAELSLEELLNVTITGVSKFSQEVEKAPAPVIVITAAQIRERGYESLSDILRDLPGFDVSENASRFGELYTIRGIEGNDRFLVLADGHKLNPAGGAFLAVGDSIPVAYARQVEIIYGPASAIYGADAFAGIINIVSTHTTPDTERETAAKNESIYNHGSIRLNTGSFKRVDGALNLRQQLSPDLTVAISGRIINAGGYDLSQNGGSAYDIIKQYQEPFSPHFEQPIRDYSLFLETTYKSFSLAYFRIHFNEGNGRGLSPQTYVMSRENKWEKTSDILWGTYKTSLGPKATLTADISYSRYRQDPDTQFLKWKTAGSPTGTLNQYMTGEENTIKAVFTSHIKLATEFSFIAGLEYENTGGIPPYANDETLGRPAKFTGEDEAAIRSLLTIRETRYASFAQLTYTPSRKVDLILGGRYDHSSRYKNAFNPRMGIIIRPFRDTSVKFIYGRAFQAPSLFYQFEQFGVPTTVMRSANEINQYEDPNWKLQNQDLQSFDICFRQSLGKRFNFEASFYRNILENLIERAVYDTSGSTWNKYYQKFTNGIRNENIGKETAMGVHVMINALPLRNVELNAHYSYTDANYETKGQRSPVPRVARHKWQTRLTIRNLFRSLTLSPVFQWRGKINTSALNPIYKGAPQPGFSNLSLSFTWDSPAPGVRIYGLLENVLDNNIQHPGLFNQSGPYMPELPQPGIHFRLGVEFKFM